MRVVAVTAHPDDEVIWFGGLLTLLARLGCSVHVVCLWGALERPGSMSAVAPGRQDIDRKDEFFVSVGVLGLSQSGIIIDSCFPVDQSKPQSDDVLRFHLEEVIGSLGFDLRSIDMFVTHSPYGDERAHPHHIRVHEFVSGLVNRLGGQGLVYPSIVPFFGVVHSPVSRGIRRLDHFHLVGRYDCVAPAGAVSMHQLVYDTGFKRLALDSYVTVDMQKHMNDYAMFTCPVECLYANRRATDSLDRLTLGMSQPNVVKNLV